MDEDLKQEKEQEQFDKAKVDKLRRDEERTRKNREKREKMKARKAKGGGDANANAHHQRALAVKNGHGEQSASGVDDGREYKDGAAEQVSLAAPAVGLVIHDDDA